MPALLMQFTNAGLDAITDAQGPGFDNVIIAQIGLTAQAFVMAPTLTALPGEFKRLNGVSGESPSPTIIHVTAYDTSADVYNVRGFGLYDDQGVLLATYSAAVDPILSKAALAFGLFSVDIAVSADMGAVISFGNAIFSYPPATKTVKGVVELADDADAEALVDDTRAMTAKMVYKLMRKVLGERFFRAFDGPADSIPAGWVLCDGQNDTPDLRDKFIIGAGPMNAVGTTGGSLEHDHNATVEGHALTVPQIPAHRHLNVVPGVSGVTLAADNSIAGVRTAGGDSEYVLNGTAAEPTVGRTSLTGGGEPHGHDLALDPASHIPPFYALAYIMKVW